MAQVKGTAIAGRLKWVSRYHGEQALKNVLDKLKDRDTAKRLAETGALKSAWYPFELLVDLTETIDRVFGKGDGALYRQVAGQTAEDDLSTVYKVFFRFMQPMFIVQKAAQLWSSYYNSGKLTATSPEKAVIELEIADFETPRWAHCESVLGWAQRSIQLTGVKGVQAQHLECRGKGARRCRMRVSWKE
jgi:hypothetical protein